MNKKILIIIILVILAGAGGFYGGMKYQESKAPTAADFQNLRNLSPQQRQQTFGQSGANASGILAGGRGGGNLPAGRQDGAAGEIIAKDDKSITIKLQDGGSKIIFFSTSTVITKSTVGSLNDFEIGTTAIVGGKQNSDGSFTAETIQLRPLTP